MLSLSVFVPRVIFLASMRFFSFEGGQLVDAAGDCARRTVLRSRSFLRRPMATVCLVFPRMSWCFCAVKLFSGCFR